MTTIHHTERTETTPSTSGMSLAEANALRDAITSMAGWRASLVQVPDTSDRYYLSVYGPGATIEDAIAVASFAHWSRLCAGTHGA